jgi:predicted DsbA family dithiol-disulfide isomerase
MDVDIWSDIACPWCYIGKRRFEAALAQFEHRDEVRIVWRSFELDPSAPPEHPGSRTVRLAKKYGMTTEQATAIEQHLTREAADAGLEFRFERARAGSTFDAHRLVHLAESRGLGDAAKERLLHAYFNEGELVADPHTLTRLAAEVGVPEDEAGEMLAGDRYAEEVRADERLAAQLGISAVPTFVVDRRLGLSGAQPPEVLLELLRQGWAHRVLARLAEALAPLR